MPTNWGWRIPSLLQMIPSALQLIFIWFLPESPRWLVSKGRGEEAYAILAKYHAEGDLNSEFVKLEYAEIETTLELEKEQAKSSWKALVAAPGMRKRLLICSFLGLATQWSGNGLTSYFLARILDNVGIHDDRTKNLINLAMTCWGFVNGTAFALTIPKLPRRSAYLTCTIALTLIFTGWTIASSQYAMTGSQAASRAVIAYVQLALNWPLSDGSSLPYSFIFLYSPAYNMGYNALTYSAYRATWIIMLSGNLYVVRSVTAYLVELFPFHARAKGIAVFQWWGRAAGFFNQFVNPIGIANAGWKYYISYCVFLLFEVIFVWFLFPETSNRTLEELAFRKYLSRSQAERRVVLTRSYSVRGRQNPRGAAKADRRGGARQQGTHSRRRERQRECASCGARELTQTMYITTLKTHLYVSVDFQTFAYLKKLSCNSMSVMISRQSNLSNFPHTWSVNSGKREPPSAALNGGALWRGPLTKPQAGLHLFYA